MGKGSQKESKEEMKNGKKLILSIKNGRTDDTEDPVSYTHLDVYKRQKGIFTTFMILGIMIFVVLLIGSFFIKVPEAPAGQSAAKELYGEGPSVMLKSASFWVFMLWCIVVNIGGLLVVNSAASIAVAFGAPAIVGMIVSVFNGAGRVIVGTIYDRKAGKFAMVVDMLFMFAGGIALLAGAKTMAMVLILIGLLAMGLCRCV